ncbi:hypothetical protein MPTK1_6g04720 [Marchantia polymorpha subsp. ruderalis]|uniref:Uncharacterized protein n=2 Tax=Marchantia polymorpha TaxID=3197 RepID=A0AAF6BNI8_MARPO|nr:hypothetical protein MARPO_0034s0046 [Marchantia polymorpha]BBN13572.1 hypothetical protein Mp_6g04720 [Marchantia polymorpha subsp. ruderalis]|eukprot:PTQ41459.1 hypothetical protein MARPO_0034s0046 [Marchantia polymorpha]
MIGSSSHRDVPATRYTIMLLSVFRSLQFTHLSTHLVFGDIVINSWYGLRWLLSLYCVHGSQQVTSGFVQCAWLRA